MVTVDWFLLMYLLDMDRGIKAGKFNNFGSDAEPRCDSDGVLTHSSSGQPRK